MTSEPAEAVPTKQRFDPRVARRMALWSASCAAALVAVVATALSESGTQRINDALARVLPPIETATAQIAPQPPAPTREILALTDTVRALAADRDKLNERIASLERTLDDVTGSIKRQQSEKAAEPAAKTEFKIEPAKETAIPPPAIAAPATVAAAVPQPKIAGAVSTPPIAPLLVPLPPSRVASAPPLEHAPAVPVRTEIGVDLGGSGTPEGLRARWSSVKANYGPLLGTLKPVMSMQERTSGAVSYRLILGPLASQAAAAALCARLTAAQVLCRPTTFNAQAAALL